MRLPQCWAAAEGGVGRRANGMRKHDLSSLQDGYAGLVA